MNVYEAIAKMRELTAKEIPFCITFMGYSRDRQSSKGVVEVRKTKLRAAATTGPLADVLLNFTDLNTHEQKHCYIPALMTFNGQKLTLS